MAFKLFVGGLPSDITSEELNVVFGTYGSVADSHVMKGKAVSGQSCAFVIMDTQIGAETSISSLDQIYSIREGDQPIAVSWAKQGGKGAPEPSAPFSYGCKGSSGFAGGGGAYTGGGGAYTGGVHQGGGGYGGAPCGTGSPYGAAPSCGGAPLYGGAPAYSGKGGKGGGGGYNSTTVTAPPPPVHSQEQKPSKLFVGNLPVDVSQEAMQMVFGTYGTVTNIHVMAGKAKSGQSCAFVEYSNSVEAETAILTLHDKYELRPGEGFIMVKYANSQGGPAQVVPGRYGPY